MSRWTQLGWFERSAQTSAEEPEERSSLSKLYSAISKQKEQELEVTTPTETSTTEDSSHKTHRGVSSKAQKHRKSQASASKRYPHGISWFISADELKAEARKENEPEEFRPSTVWFEAVSRKPAWREPLRQRPVEEQRNTIQKETDPGQSKNKPSSVPQVNLQTGSAGGGEATAGPFNQEREELFIQPGGPGRLPRPAGTAHLRRAVPRKEMIQRSKQIYENLPEVRRRKEEERRQAEYKSYRLNAQLYNKRVTNRVLGRRSAWS
ncbi:hypothetical protein WMY93_016725 [Mugilogobius chulae]|uniref:ALMS motif domain-containing protein n=1 Tax=Mugilogobius chulae TaxID=88201 RepID=A0AAW0NME1_9GOBI